MQTAKRVTSNFTKEDLKMLEELKQLMDRTQSGVIRQAIISLYKEEKLKEQLENGKARILQNCS